MIPERDLKMRAHKKEGKCRRGILEEVWGARAPQSPGVRGMWVLVEPLLLTSVSSVNRETGGRWLG